MLEGRGKSLSSSGSGLSMDVPGRKPSLVEDAYEAIKKAIREGVFAPGYRGSEQEIASRLAMSRTPVHEAIIRLQGEGMVQLLPKRGVVIRALSPSDMREVYDVVIAIEGMSALLLAERDSVTRQEVCAELRALNGSLAEALERDDLATWAVVDARFHETIVERCGNSRLAVIARTNIDQSFRARRLTLSLRSKPTASVAEHSTIIEAIAAGDASAARESAQDHKIRARDEIVSLLRRYDMKHL